MDITMVFIILLLSVTAGYIIFIVVLTYGLIKMHSAKRMFIYPTSPKKVSVSVIIPVRNESLNIRNCLEDMLVQDYPREMTEFVVTDDFSEDHTLSFVQFFIQQHPDFPLTVISPKIVSIPETGKKKALSRAINHASGELILTTDADTRRGSAWISAMVAAYNNGRYQMVLGPVAYDHENNLLCKIQSLEFLGLIGTTASSAYFHIPLMGNGANLAYQRTAFLETGGFEGNSHLASGDDVFIMTSIRKKFGKKSIGFVLDPKAIVYTEAESSLSGFISQRLRWVSKSKGYRGKGIIIVSLLTWATHFLLLSGIMIGLFHPLVLTFSLGLWMLKVLAEYPLVWIMAHFFKKTKLLEYYFLAQVYQLIYVVLIGVAGNLFSFKWKGRKLKN